MRSISRLSIILSMLLAGGCNVMGIGSYVAGGGMKSPPEYKLPKQPTIVLVENYQNPDLYAVPAERIGRAISDELTDNKAATMVDPVKVADLKTSDPADFHKMDIPALGRAVGAKQIIYVNLVTLSADTPQGGERLAGKAEARVRVVDAETGKTLWPLDTTGGRIVQYQTSYAAQISDAQRAQVEDQICQNMSSKIARFFHETPFDDPQAEADKGL